MAFDQTSFAPILSSTAAPANFSYSSSVDTLETISSADYFDSKKFQLSASDLIYVKASDNDGLIVYRGEGLASSLLTSVGTGPYDFEIIVKSASDLQGSLRSDVVYYIDGVIDMGAASVEVPANGLNLKGHTFEVSQLISTENNYTLFTSPVSGSGNLLATDMSFSTSGTGSQVFDLTDSDGTHAIEFGRCNFNSCTSLGELTDYRQILEDGNGRFGGSPEITLSGSMNGYRITTSIVRSVSGITSLFQEGTSLVFASRFITDINCDLPATGALLDFKPSNFSSDEALELQGCFVTRGGTLDASDTTIYPNIDHTDVQSNWDNNAGLPNTQKYIKASCTTEVTTTISVINTYYPLEGTFTVDTQVHFDVPSNGEFRLLSGNGSYQVTGDLVIDGTANNEIDVRVTKSTDGGATWPTEINHIRRQINSLVGGRDVAFFPLNFVVVLAKNDRIRLEVENKSGTGNVTMELDSYFIITEV